MKSCAVPAAFLLLSMLHGAAVASPPSGVLRECSEDPRLCLGGGRQAWCEAACKTLEKSVDSVLDGIAGEDDVVRAARVMVQDWEKWKGSAMFRLKGPDDIKAFGNLYSLRAMVRTLQLAARDIAASGGRNAEEMEENAAWLAAACGELYQPVEQILLLQSYDGKVHMRLEIMNGLFPYLDRFYEQHANRRRIAKLPEHGGQKP